MLFTGLFWLLLFLWRMPFHLLKIDFFRELFEEPPLRSAVVANLLDDLAKGNVSARPAKWYDLLIGKHEYRIAAAGRL
jgi:hypothetical protein